MTLTPQGRLSTMPHAMNDPEDGLNDYTLSPFLQRIRIRGYKSIEFCDVALSPLTILVGRNGAGKSNFLDALEFLSDLMDKRAVEVVNDRRGWRAIQHHGTPKEAVEIGGTFGFRSGATDWTAEYHFALKMGEGNQIRIVQESLKLQDGKREVGYRCEEGEVVWLGVEHFRGESNLFRAPEPDQDSQRLDNPQLFRRRRYDRLLLSVIGTQPFVDLTERLRSSRVYNFVPEEIRKHQPMSASPSLERDGGNLARAIEGIREIEAKDVERVKSYLQAIVPEVKDFFKTTYGDNETLRFQLHTSRDEQPAEFDASSMSDGTLRVLASLVAAFQYVLPAGHPGYVGIEEPETALHPAAMRSLVDALDEATQRTQIFLTTHSADLLSGRDIQPGQVLVVRNRNGKTQVTPLDPASREIVQK